MVLIPARSKSTEYPSRIPKSMADLKCNMARNSVRVSETISNGTLYFMDNSYSSLVRSNESSEMTRRSISLSSMALPFSYASVKQNR